MDRLLKNENLDLKLIPYRVLATDLSNGMVEFVPNSMPMSVVISTYGNNIKVQPRSLLFTSVFLRFPIAAIEHV